MEQQNLIFTPKPIDLELWFKRAKEDDANFLKNVLIIYDKIGLIGENLFDLTLDNQSALLGYRSVLIQTGENSAKGMFTALCPELESFVTLINWAGTSEERNKERLEVYHNLDKFYNEQNSKMTCIIKGNHRLKRGEYSTIILFRGTIEITDKINRFYEWERAPFLKRSSETFAYFPSPIFMTSIKSKEENVAEDKVFYFTCPFKVKYLLINQLKISLISTTKSTEIETDVYIYDNEVITKIKKETNQVFIGLFEDKIFKKRGEFEREFVLLQVSQDNVDGNELIAHLITQRMYYIYLKNKKLKICSNEKFKDRLKKIVFQVGKQYGFEMTMNYNDFCKCYLDAYFYNVNEFWYYKPYILKDLNKEQFIEFLDYLEELERGENTLKILEMKKKYSNYVNAIDFLNCYNLFSKRTLIDLIKNYNTLEGLSKWEM